MERGELKALLRSQVGAEERNGHVFLTDPAWSARDRASVSALQQSAWADRPQSPDRGWLCVPTGGSSGSVRFARHDEHTLTAAVRGFCTHFGFERVNAVGVLPPHHVSGLLARVRCAATGGRYLAWDWKQLEAGAWPELGGGEWVLSLVPTQLQRLLASPQALAPLRGFRIIFVGGGPVWPELADAAARAELPVSLGYGLTETAAMVTALHPADFLAGVRSSGPALAHARVAVNADGRVTVAGESLFRGYFPDTDAPAVWETDDLGRMDERGHLHLLGRRDAVIITGGKKVQPLEVEATLRASGEFTDVAVLGLPDAEWGQVVVACYPAGAREPEPGRVQAALAALPAYKRPKRLVPVANWPRNAQGKLNRAALAEAAQAS